TYAKRSGRRGVLIEKPGSLKLPAENPSTRRMNGDRESDLGPQPDSRRAHERRPSCGPLDHPADPEDGRPAAGSAAPDLVRDLPPCALGSDCRCRFLHDRGVEVAAE